MCWLNGTGNCSDAFKAKKEAYHKFRSATRFIQITEQRNHKKNI